MLAARAGNYAPAGELQGKFVGESAAGSLFGVTTVITLGKGFQLFDQYRYGMQVAAQEAKYVDAMRIANNFEADSWRASRVTFETDGFNSNGFDPISLEKFGNLITENPVSNAALKQVQKAQATSGGAVKPEFGEGPARLAGEVRKTMDGTIDMRLYMLSNQNSTARGAAASFVHESSHYVRASRGFEIGTQIDEYMAFRRELFFELGRRPTILERKHMWLNKIQNNSYYSNYPLDGDLPKIPHGLSE